MKTLVLFTVMAFAVAAPPAAGAPLESLDQYSIESKAFFVHKIVSPNGDVKYNGIEVLDLKKYTETRLLDNGKSITLDASARVFFGASDGLYSYNADKNIAEKYGSIGDDIISLTKEWNGNDIYILTANKDVYKVTNNGNVKEKMKNIVNAKQIRMDKKNNIYFITYDKEMYILTVGGNVKKVSGLPDNKKDFTFIEASAIEGSVPPNFVDTAPILCVIDYHFYKIYPDGTAAHF